MQQRLVGLPDTSGEAETTGNVWSLNRCSTPFCFCVSNWWIPSRVSAFVVQVFRGRTHQLGHSVDIDLSLLQASTEEHGRRHQKVVSYAVSINVQRCDLAAVVGADLEETCMQSEFAGEYVLFVDSHVVFGGTDDLELIIYSNIESKWESV